MATLSRETVQHVVGAACLAPSVHNTQPWVFTWHDDVLDVHADHSKQLHVLDPYARQLHISCGAAIEHARVAARGLGLQVATELLPDPGDEDHLARIRLVAGQPAGERELALADALLDRHTHRDLFAPDPIDEGVLEALRIAVNEDGATLRVVRTEDDLVNLEVLLARADAEETRDPAYQDELRRWTGDGARADEGIPSWALGDPSSFRSSLSPRVFPGAGTAGVSCDPPAAEHPLVVVIGTDSDGPLDWLVAGEALGALLLTAATYGVMAQPLGQATDRDAYRRRLGDLLGLTGCPQMALRLGYVIVPKRGTPRRHVDQVLRYPMVADG